MPGRPSYVDPDIEQRIIDLHLEGLSARGIARQLNSEGIPTPFNAQIRGWEHQIVLRVLRRTGTI